MKNIAFLCILLFLISSCKKKNLDISNLNGNKIECLGDGGMGMHNRYPMNSYESISECLDLGADGTEFDVQLTKDSVLVLYHSRELSESTNFSGIVNSYNWNKLKNAHYTLNPDINYSIISIDQLFKGTRNLNSYIFTFDCKLYAVNENLQFYRTYVNAIINLTQKYNLEKENICIESQSPDFLKICKQLKPDWKLYIYPTSFQNGLDVASSLHLFGITIASGDITKDQVQIAHNNNLRVTLWDTFYPSDNYHAVKKNPDCIETEDVKNLLKLLK